MLEPHCPQLIEKVKAWSVELQLLCFKTAKAVLLQTYRFLNLMAVMLEPRNNATAQENFKSQ
jgi:hypothetical protein